MTTNSIFKKGVGLIGFAIASLSAVANEAQSDWIKLPLERHQDGHIIVTASINSIPSEFVLDTGASGTVIDTQRLSSFGITQTENKIKGYGLGDSETSHIESQTIIVDSLALAGINTGIKQLYSHDTSTQMGQYAGIIGQDAIVALKARLDISSNNLLIPKGTKHTDTQLDSASYIALQKHPMGLFFVDAKINKQPVKLIIDTGAPSTIIDANSAKDLALKLTPHEKAKSIDQHGNEHPVMITEKAQIELDGTDLSGHFFTTDISGLLQAISSETERFVGVIGLQELKKINALLDLSQNKIYISD